MSLGKFIEKYSQEFGIILTTLIPLVEASNIFNEDKQNIRQLLEDAKERVVSLNEWLDKHGLEANETPIVIRRSDIDDSVERYASERMTNDRRELELFIEQKMSQYRPVGVDPLSESGGATIRPSPSSLDHPAGTEGTEGISARVLPDA